MFKRNIRNIAGDAPLSPFAFRQDGYQILQPGNGLKFQNYPFKIYSSEDNSPVIETDTPTLRGADRRAEFDMGFCINKGRAFDVSRLPVKLDKPFLIQKEFEKYFLTKGKREKSEIVPEANEIPVYIGAPSVEMVDITSENVSEAPKVKIKFKIDENGILIRENPLGLFFEIHHLDIAETSWRESVPINHVIIKSAEQIWEGVRSNDDPIGLANIPIPSDRTQTRTLTTDNGTRKEYKNRVSYRWLYSCEEYNFYGSNNSTLINDYSKGLFIPTEPGKTLWRFIPPRQSVNLPVMIFNDMWFSIRGTKNV